MYRHILVATDGSAISMPAIRMAADLAKALGAKLTALTVVAPYFPPDSGKAYGSLSGFRRDGDGLIGARRRTLAGDPARGAHEEMRPDRDGLARAARNRRPAAGQRDHQGADALENPRAGVPLMPP
jgi:nucleotide-binding universal stress UspA family protein